MVAAFANAPINSPNGNRVGRSGVTARLAFAAVRSDCANPILIPTASRNTPRTAVDEALAADECRFTCDGRRFD